MGPVVTAAAGKPQAFKQEGGRVEGLQRRVAGDGGTHGGVAVLQAVLEGHQSRRIRWQDWDQPRGCISVITWIEVPVGGGPGESEAVEVGLPGFLVPYGL
jgi:hypothetical protein